MMFSLTSSLIRPVSLPNTTRQLDLTVLRLPQSHQDYTFKRSNKHQGRGLPENCCNFKKTRHLITNGREVKAEVKISNTKGRWNKKKKKREAESWRPIALGQMFCVNVVMTVWSVYEQSAIPRGCLWRTGMITNTDELGCMNTELIGIISVLPHQLLYFNM